MKKISFLILFLASYLYSETLHFDISFVGITVVKAKFIYRDNSLQVFAISTGMAKLLKSLDNKYIAKYNDNSDSLFLPSYFKKDIAQKDFYEKRQFAYKRDITTARMLDFINNKSKEYKIPYDIRDFFSTLYYLRYHQKDTLSFYIDANTVLWKGSAVFIKKEKITMDKKDYLTRKYQITYKKISKENKKENSDMLTNNLVGNSKTLYLWFTEDKNHLPIKAKFKMKPFSVFWTLNSVKN